MAETGDSVLGTIQSIPSLKLTEHESQRAAGTQPGSHALSTYSVLVEGAC